MSNVNVSTAPVPSVREGEATGPIDGWVCAAAATSSKTGGPVSVFAKLPSLLCHRIFQDRALTAEEQDLQETMTMRHSAAGEVRSINRLFHHRWLGIEGTPLAGALMRASACLPWITSATGDASECRETGTACGSQRFCVSCEKVFETTSSVPPMAAVLRAVGAVLDMALQEWSQGQSGSWCHRELSQAPHNCDASYPRNPEAGR